MKIKHLRCALGFSILTLLSSSISAQDSIKAPTKQAEMMVVESLRHLDQLRLNDALTVVTELTELHPDYHLAQMLRADLLSIRAGNFELLARVQELYPITSGRLRNEAEVRWQYAHTDDAVAEMVLHANVLKVGQQPHLVLINLAKSRLYLYENRQGALHLLASYYISMGTGGAGKQREGDRKTPIGVYHITDWVPGNRLADLYGFGALPLDYPNIWDQAQGRTGHGIWLHGTPSNTFSRPPMSSQGCVVLNNDEMSSLVTQFNVGLATPVIILNNDSDMQYYESEKIEVLTEVNAWLVDQKVAFDWQQVSVYRYPDEQGLYYATFPSKEKPDHLVHQYWRRGHDGGWQLVLQTLHPKRVETRLS